MTAALRTEAVGKTYGDRPALEPLTLEVAAGQRVALVGHNGSGKTTLLKIAAGVLEPTTGSVEVFGHRAGSVEARRSLSWIADTPSFYDDLSVWEHLEYVARLHGVAEWQARAAHLLERMGISHRRDDIPSSFSRGLRQKAAIALACVRPFQLLLVDEPFVGLDVAGKEALLALFDDAAADGATLVVATHELTFLDRVDRVVELEDGHLLRDSLAP